MRRTLNIILALGMVLAATSLARASYMPFNTNVNMNVGIGTSTPQGALVVTNGNVGIGTWAPAEPFQVGTLASGAYIDNSGNIITQGGSVEAGSSVFATYFEPYSASTDLILLERNAGIDFGTSPSAIFAKFDTNGNLGIGTTVPGARLDVEGTLYPTVFYANGIANNVGIGSMHPGQALDVQGTVRATGFTAGAAGITLGGVTNTSWPAAGSNYWTLSSGVGIGTYANVGIGTTTPQGGFVVTNGYVGIGTWAPANPLEVGLPGSNGPITFTTPNGNAGMVIYASGTSSGTGVLQRSSGLFSILSASSGIPANGHGIILDDNGNVGIGTILSQGGLSVMTGNVGIGTWIPGNTLDVKGALQITNPNGGNYTISYNNAIPADSADLIFSSGTGLQHAGFQFNTGNDAGSFINSLSIDKNGNVGIGTLLSTAGLAVMNGNVGIGTWIPSATLDIGGIGTPTWNHDMLAIKANAADIEGMEFSNANTGGSVAFTLSGGATQDQLNFLSFGPANSGNTYGINNWAVNEIQATAGYLILSETNVGGFMFVTNNGSNTSERIRIDKNGNIGIGTITPIASIGIVGNVGLGTGANSPYITTAPPSGGMIVEGNVGIGSLTPGTALDVKGTVRATGFIAGAAGITLDGVTNTSWPAAGANYWTLQTSGNIGISTIQNVGIGTSFVGGAGEASFAVMNGNVGIGTWIPAGSLDITADGTISGGLILHEGSGTTARLYLKSDGAGDYNWFMTRGGVDSTGISMSASGKVSIGQAISSADPQLLVNGALSDTTHNFNYNMLSQDTAAAAQDVGGGIGFSGNADVTGRTFAAIQGGHESSTAGTYDGYLRFFTRVNGSASMNERMRITSTGNVGIGTTTPLGGLSVMNGNVGIGTWIPAGSLQIGNGANPFYIDSTGMLHNMQNQSGVSLGGISLTFNSSGSPSITNNGTGGMAYIGGGGANSFAYMQSTAWSGVAQNDYIKFLVGTSGGTEAMRIQDNAGAVNIGIGTSVPSAALDVEGTLYPTVFYANGIANNVGIGTMHPGTALDVNGKIRSTSGGFVFPDNTIQTTAAGASSNYWTLQTSGNIGISTIQNVGIGTSFVGGAGEASFAVMNGNVGIGTWVPGGGLVVLNGNTGLGVTAPISILDVRGASNTTFGSSNPFVSTYYSNDGFAANMGGGLNLGGFYDGSHQTTFGYIAGLKQNGTSGDYGGMLAFGTRVNGSNSNITKMVIDTNGNVGIGTTNPLGGLTVMNGNVGIGTWIPNGALIVSSGSVGIGTNNPNAPLDILSSGTTNATLPGFNFDRGDTTARTHLQHYFADISYLTQNLYRDAGSGTWSLDNSSDYGVGIIMNANNAVAPQGISFVTTETGFSGNALTRYRMFINTSGNVGIGTIAPRGTLDVTGANATASPLIVDSNAHVGIGTTLTTTSGLTVMNGNVGLGTWVPKGTLDVGSTGTICLGGTCNSTWPAGGSNYWTLQTSGNIGISTIQNVGIGTSFVGGAGEGALSVMNGNVGIGTWIPGALFQVGNGTSAATIDSSGRITTNGGVNATLLGHVTYGGTADSYLSNSNLGIGTTLTTTSALSVMNGNVGIGTWVPTSILDVKGEVDIHNTSNSGYMFMYYNSALTGDSAGLSFSTPGNVSNSGFNFVTRNAGGNQISAFGINHDGNVGIGTSITVAGLVVMTGNVGIGTWIPQQTLDINGGIRIAGTVSNTTLNTSGGNVGIGTSNPGSLLDVGGNARMTGFTLNSGSSLNGKVLTSDASGNGTWQTAQTGTNYWTLQTSGNIGISTIQNVGIGTSFVGGAGEGALSVMNGNVGIGTWVPAAMLQIGGGSNYTTIPPAGTGIGIADIEGGSTGFILNAGQLTGNSSTGFTILNNNGGTGMNIYGGSGSGTRLTLASTNSSGTSDYINFKTGSPTERMRIDTNGNVGIGTVAPMSAFDVVGNVGIGTISYSKYITTVPGGNLVVEGNVGIGTWVPASALQVSGGMIVNRTAVADTNYTAAATDYIIAFTTLTASRTVTLPSSICQNGRVFTIKDESGNAGTDNIVISPSSGNIDGGASVTISKAYNAVDVYCGGGNWYVK